MAKIIYPAQLAQALTTLLTNPAAVGKAVSGREFGDLMTQLTRAACDFGGGEIYNPAALDEDEGGNPVWVVAIHGDDHLPADGGVWAQFDPTGELLDDEEQPPESPAP